MRVILISCACLLCPATWADTDACPVERELRLAEINEAALTYRCEVGESGRFTWWLPDGVDEYVLPMSGGVVVSSSDSASMRWLRSGSPWSLLTLPILGLRYGDQLLVVIVPWPHHASLIVDDRVGIRFALPEGRHDAAPCEIVALLRQGDALEVARAFREWRREGVNTGLIPEPRPLNEKIADLDKVGRLLGAPHFYLWGPALFSRHDVPRNSWVALAGRLDESSAESVGGRLVNSFGEDQRDALRDLAAAQWPMDYLTVAVAGAINEALKSRELWGLEPETPAAEVIFRNQRSFADEFKEFVNPPESWGDGLSRSLLNLLREAGVDRALLLLSDLKGKSLRPDVVAFAEESGFLLGPYDSYHSVHSPTAGANDTWETAQFDRAAFEQGRVINADGSGHAGFKGRGYHFSPRAAWPYVQQRVNGIVEQAPYSAWFVDCDATAECFEDYSLIHPATKVEDTRLRRQRLGWLESEHGMVVGSEGGSVLFADVIHFGHGIHTPYVGHLDPSFRDRQGRHYLGRHWPPDTPEQSFKPVPIPPALKSPYFDPAVRIPLYQAALGDELITTHHWSFDSMKFEDLAKTRELMEILYMVPPMYHLNRATWPERRNRILDHLAFWGPLHRELAAAPLIRFAWVTEDRLVQETVFQTGDGEVTITVNFDETSRAGYPSCSATATRSNGAPGTVYQVER